MARPPRGAEDEAYLGAAAPFRAYAKAERVHLQRFVGLMTARDIAPPSEAAPRIAVGSTCEDLQTAVILEQGERDSVSATRRRTTSRRTSSTPRDAEVEHATSSR